MPRAKQYATNADRQAAYNERKREAERIRQAALRAAAQRRQVKVRSLHETAASILYQFAISDALAEDQEGRAIMRQLCKVLAGQDLVS